MDFLVIGANSYIGYEIYKKLSEVKYNVVGTVCHNKEKYRLLYHFDIKTDSIKNCIPVQKDAKRIAVICSAISSIDYCKVNYEEAYEVNVIKTKKLMQDLYQLGYKIVYFSTDNVFDGKRGNYDEGCEKNPINTYGKMKAEIEDYLIKSPMSFCILRLGKIFGNQYILKNPLYDWLCKINKGEGLACIKGNITSFTDVSDVVRAFKFIINKNLSGLYNFSSGEVMSRKDITQKFVSIMGLETSVREEALENFHFVDHRPLITYLNSQKFEKETGFKFHSLEETMKEFKEKSRI